MYLLAPQSFSTFLLLNMTFLLLQRRIKINDLVTELTILTTHFFADKALGCLTGNMISGIRKIILTPHLYVCIHAYVYVCICASASLVTENEVHGLT